MRKCAVCHARNGKHECIFCGKHFDTAEDVTAHQVARKHHGGHGPRLGPLQRAQRKNYVAVANGDAADAAIAEAESQLDLPELDDDNEFVEDDNDEGGEDVAPRSKKRASETTRSTPSKHRATSLTTPSPVTPSAEQQTAATADASAAAAAATAAALEKRAAFEARYASFYNNFFNTL